MMTAIGPAEPRSIGTYALGRALGRGATSEVFEATRGGDGARVALKLLRADLAGDPAATEAFLGEIAKTRAIAHPSVVRVLDFGLDPATGRYFLVMERVDGESLADRLRRGPLDEAAARALFAAVADGVAAAHQRGIVHRDLKPGNIVLGRTPTIIDFGIATYLDRAQVRMTTRRAGTPAYMAPEQRVGGRITPATDVWALGASLFEAVTGRLPFDDGDGAELPARAPSARAHAAISPALDALIARCLEREPSRRPAIEDVAAALEDPACALPRVTEDAPLEPAAPAVAVYAPRAARGLLEPATSPALVTAHAPPGRAAAALLARGSSRAAVHGLRGAAPFREPPVDGAAAGVAGTSGRRGARRWWIAGIAALAIAAGVLAALRFGGSDRSTPGLAAAGDEVDRATNAPPRAPDPTGAPDDRAGGPAEPTDRDAGGLTDPAAAPTEPAGGEPSGSAREPAETRAAAGDHFVITDLRVPDAAAAAGFEVDVTSVPSGAEVVIDGATRGRTPMRLPLDAPTSVVVRRRGYRPARVRAERAGVIEVRLIRARRTRTRRPPATRHETLD